jgi:hypothetical protein
MEMMGLREFRDNIADIDEPVTVVKTRGGVKSLGIWIPEGVEFQLDEHGRPVPAKKARKRAVS